MKSFFAKLFAISYQVRLLHTRLPSVFMKKKESLAAGTASVDLEPLEFVGSEYRNEGAPGFTDDRVRNDDDYVAYAPRKVVPDLMGGGDLVSEDYPQNVARALDVETTEANTPRQTRGQKLDTLTEIHDSQRIFDVAVATFDDTLDTAPPEGEPAAWDGKANPTTKQPENPFNARYPYNHVRETESGHLFEADDTPGAERIKESHRAGTYYEVFPDGSKVEKIVRDNFTVIVGHDKVNIQGSAIVTIEGDCNFYTKGNFTQQVDGDYNLLVKGKHTVQVADDVTLDCHSDYYHYVGNQIDPAKGIVGRGNKGGEAKTEVAGDYQLHVSGVASEIYGDKDLYDKNKTTTKHQTLLFGDEKNQIIGGFKFDQIDNNRTEIVGKNYTTQIVGNKSQTIEGLYTSHSNEKSKITSDDDFEWSGESITFSSDAINLMAGSTTLKVDDDSVDIVATASVTVNAPDIDLNE